MAYNITAKNINVSESEKVNDFWTKYSEYMLDRINRLKEKELLDLDDVEYHQNWWKWYCQENKLDVNTGKSLGRYPMPSNYTLF